WLNALKRLVRTSSAVPSPSPLIFPNLVCFTRLRSMLLYFGPRKELRPMPGGPDFVMSKNFAPPPGKLPPRRMNASLEVSSRHPPKYRVGRIGPKGLPLGCLRSTKILGV